LSAVGRKAELRVGVLGLAAQNLLASAMFGSRAADAKL